MYWVYAYMAYRAYDCMETVNGFVSACNSAYCWFRPSPKKDADRYQTVDWILVEDV
jgi:hypothetical protein